MPANDVALKQDAFAFKILKQNPLVEFNIFSAFLRFPHPGEISVNLSRHLSINPTSGGLRRGKEVEGGGQFDPPFSFLALEKIPRDKIF